MQRFDIAEPPVIKLRWNPNNDSILAIAPDRKGTVVTIFAADIANTVSYFLYDHDLTSDPLDASWLSASEFVLCGGDLLLSLRYAEGAIVPQRKFDTGQDARLSEVHFDDRSRLVATASEKGIIDVSQVVSTLFHMLTSVSSCSFGTRPEGTAPSPHI